MKPWLIVTVSTFNVPAFYSEDTITLTDMVNNGKELSNLASLIYY